MIQPKSTRDRLVLLIVILGPMLVGCPGPIAPAPIPPVSPAPQVPEVSRRLESVPLSTLDALILAGFEQAYAYTWQGGRLTGFMDCGSFKLEVDQLDTEVRSDLSAVSKSPIDPEQVRGLVVFVVRPAKKPDEPRECLFGIRLFADGKDSSPGATSMRTIPCTLPDFRMSGSTSDATFHITPADGKQRTIFHFALAPLKPVAKP